MVETAGTLHDDIARLKERRTRERARVADAKRKEGELHSARGVLLLADDKRAVADNARELADVQRVQSDGAAILSAIDVALADAGSKLYESTRDAAAAELRDVETQLAAVQVEADAANAALRDAQGRISVLNFRRLALIEDTINDERRRRVAIEGAVND